MSEELQDCIRRFIGGILNIVSELGAHRNRGVSTIPKTEDFNFELSTPDCGKDSIMTDHSSSENHFAVAHDGLASIMGYLVNVDVPPFVKQGILRNAIKISQNLEDNERRYQQIMALNTKLCSLCPADADILLSGRHDTENTDIPNKEINRLLLSAKRRIKKSPLTGNETKKD